KSPLPPFFKGGYGVCQFKISALFLAPKLCLWAPIKKYYPPTPSLSQYCKYPASPYNPNHDID
ncbi:MAG: hypothetical protein U1B30_10545, partial [Pseudomonadota bacterium]|nr:hypothetical protein [Pseudomonadota bacterium]